MFSLEKREMCELIDVLINLMKGKSFHKCMYVSKSSCCTLNILQFYFLNHIPAWGGQGAGAGQGCGPGWARRGLHRAHTPAWVVVGLARHQVPGAAEEGVLLEAPAPKAVSPS